MLSYPDEMMDMDEYYDTHLDELLEDVFADCSCEEDDVVTYWCVDIINEKGECVMSAEYPTLREALDAQKMLREDPEYDEYEVMIEEWD